MIKSYPWYTPFQYAGNNPVLSVDVDGLEAPEEGRAEEEGRTEEESKMEWEEVERLERERSAQKELEEDLWETLPNGRRVRRSDEAVGARWRNRWNDLIKGWRQGARGYFADALEAGQFVFGQPIEIMPMKPIGTGYVPNGTGNMQINESNSKLFEAEVTKVMMANKDYREVRTQVEFIVTGTYNGVKASAKIRIDNVGIRENLTLDWTEAKFSLEEITTNNMSETFTSPQKNAMFLILKGNNLQITTVGSKLPDMYKNINLVGLINKITIVPSSYKPSKAASNTSNGTNSTSPIKKGPTMTNNNKQ